MKRLVAVAVLVTAVACGGSGGRAPIERAGSDTTATSSTPRSTSTSTSTSTTSSTTTAPTVVGTDTCPPPLPRRQPDPDRPEYDVTVSADPASGAVRGRQTVWFTPDLPVWSVVLRLWANAPRLASVGTSLTVESAADEHGRSLRSEQPDPTTLVVELGRAVAPGERIGVNVAWRLQVEGPVNDRISRQNDSLRLGSFVPLLAWEPGIGWAVEPPTSGFAEAATSPTADWVLRVDAPAGYDVIASGTEDAPRVWSVTAARDVAVSVGHFTVEHAVAMAPDPVDVVVAVHDGVARPGDFLGQLVDELETYARWFGPYPWPTYQVSVTPSLSGGIEFPMHVLQGPDTAGRTTPHEAAHMWFYGLVGNNQAQHPWLDEGLATYAEARYLGTLGSMRARSIPTDGRGRAAEPMTYWESRSSSYYRSVYVQSAAALSRLGDPALVDCALARYVARNAFGIARPDDLAAALDEVFREWRPTLAGAGLP